MRRLKVLVALLVICPAIIVAQDTISHITGGCEYNGFKTTHMPASCPHGVFFSYLNDTLTINGTIGANCCGTHFALIQALNDTIFISTIDTGELCTCTCGFCFEIKIPASTTDTIVYLNGTFFNTKSGLNSIDDNVSDNIIQIIPNPFDNQLIIKTESEIIHSVWISDLTGRIIRNIDHSESNEISIDTRSIPSGIYIIQLTTTDNQLINKKIIKN